MPTTAILGVSGYAGQGDARPCAPRTPTRGARPQVGLLAGEQPSALDVRLNGSLPAFATNERAAEAGADVVFLCLGHEAAAAFALG